MGGTTALPDCLLVVVSSLQSHFNICTVLSNICILMCTVSPLKTESLLYQSYYQHSGKSVTAVSTGIQCPVKLSLSRSSRTCNASTCALGSLVSHNCITVVSETHNLKRSSCGRLTVSCFNWFISVKTLLVHISVII